jgi:hypothetical protein
MNGDRRRSLRYPFYAAAEVTEIQSGIRLAARTSELSRHGCYMDMMNPLPVATAVNLNLLYNEQLVRAVGLVIYSQPNVGMAVAFGEIPQDDELVLDKWLGHLQEANSGTASL